jgi:hypothetical protein
LLLVSSRLSLIASFAALLMAFTRVYADAHYPVDVLAGLAVGATVATLVSLAAAGPVERLVAWAPSKRLRPLLSDAARTGAPLLLRMPSEPASRTEPTGVPP